MDSQFNFNPITKRVTSMGNTLPDNVVRVNRKSIVLGRGLNHRFATADLETGKRMPLNIAYDDVHQAIKLSQDGDSNGWSFFKANSAEDGLFRLNANAMVSREHIVVGDYVEVEGHRNVFVLAR